MWSHFRTLRKETGPEKDLDYKDLKKEWKTCKFANCLEIFISVTVDLIN